MSNWSCALLICGLLVWDFVVCKQTQQVVVLAIVLTET